MLAVVLQTLGFAVSKHLTDFKLLSEAVDTKERIKYLNKYRP
jgi:hypothetical protein